MKKLLIVGQNDDGTYSSFLYEQESPRLSIMFGAIASAMNAGGHSDIGGRDTSPGGPASRTFSVAATEMLRKGGA